MRLRSGARPAVLAGLAYVAVAAVVYGPTLRTFFLSDDFYFLGIVSHAAGPGVVFKPLVGRFVRPLIVGLYYVSYHTAGLRPWLYHLLTIAPHVVASWLLFLSLARLAGEAEALWAFLAGLIFLVFAGHSEAVSWPAGAADPLLGAALMSAFYCYVRAVDIAEPGRSETGRSNRGRWMFGFFTALAVAALAKESWVAFPGVLVAHAAVFWFPDRGERPARPILLAIGGAVALVLAYFLMRRVVFGSITGGYAGLAGAFGDVGMIRAFLLRCFLPSGSVAANLWLSGLDRWAWLAVVLAIALRTRGRALRMVLFGALAMAAALVPVLPLTISVSTTESERFVYVPTLFSSVVLVWAIRSVIRWRTAAVVVCAGFALAHAAMLTRTNRVWHDAGALARDIVHGYAEQVRLHDPESRSRILILALPDDIGGPFVFRTGFLSAVELLRPDVAGRLRSTAIVAGHGLRTAVDRTVLTRRGNASYVVDFGANRIVQPELGSNTDFRISERTPTSFAIAFREASDRRVVLYVTGGRVELVDVLEGSELPFGVVDIPNADAVCEGPSLRIAGWALASRGRLRRVRLERADTGALLGETTGIPGVRPDVAAALPANADRDRAGWEFSLPCIARDEFTLRVVAEDDAGRTRVIGERRVLGRTR